MPLEQLVSAHFKYQPGWGILCNMQKEILDYLKTQRVGVLSVEMMDGSPHGATVHFANSESPTIFYFETDRDYKKSEVLFGREVTRASFVVGVSEKEPRTLQVDGEVRLIKPEEKAEFEKIYLGRFPEKAKKMDNSNSVFFLFIPKWWRFIDFAHKEGKLVLAS